MKIVNNPCNMDIAMADLAQRPVVVSDPLLTINDETSQAAVNFSQSIPESSPKNESVINNPPLFPNLKGLTLAERNVVRRSFEKSMFAYLTQRGSLSNDSEICGPCLRTGTRCIRHPLVKKCALCFRRHDVCEMWDDSVQNNGGRRVHPKVQKKANKTDVAKLENNYDEGLSVERWAAQFKQASIQLSEKRIKDEEELNAKLRKAMFPKKNAENNTDESSATDTHTTTNTKKRKRLDSSIDPNHTQKKLITLKLDSHLRSTVPPATRDDTTASLELSYMPSQKLRIRPNKTTSLSSDSTNPTVRTNDSILFPKRLNSVSKIALDRSTTTPIKLSNSTEAREPYPSDHEPEKIYSPTIVDLPQRSAKTIAYDARVERVYSDGTLKITPCIRRFTLRRQCVKGDSSKSCCWCLRDRKHCKGTIELGKWTDVGGKRVWKMSMDEEAVKYRAAVDLSIYISGEDRLETRAKMEYKGSSTGTTENGAADVTRNGVGGGAGNISKTRVKMSFD